MDFDQGSYTDYHQCPFERRMEVAPLHGKELEAYEWIMNKLQEENPTFDHDDLISAGFDGGYFYYGKNDELRVNDTLPY